MSVVVAFTAGLLSFLSPCVLPLIPSYVGFITGMTVEEAEQGGAGRRWNALLHGLWFVGGFTLVFVLLGAAASAVGGLLREYQIWLGRAGGVLLILFGLYLLGVLRPAFLMREWRVQLAHKPLGYFGSGVVGFTFGAAWTPCIGPILGGILTLAATQTGLAQGMGLLTVYALGLAVPFLVTAVALDRFLIWFQRFRPYIVWVDRVAGGMLIVLGILLITDSFTLLAGYLQSLTPQFLRERL
jgi:cytochrome c-type biogenesis protein